MSDENALVSEVVAPDIMTLTYTTLSHMTEHERFKKLLDVHSHVRAAMIIGAPIAAQIAFDIACDTKISPQVRIMAAFGILDRAGLGTKTLQEDMGATNSSQNIGEKSVADLEKMLIEIDAKLSGSKK